MPVFDKYVHKPFAEENTIRLVILDADKDKRAPVTCQIIEQQISVHNAAYTAISYVWGKQELSRTLEIRCDGDVWYLRITPSLDAMLQCLRARGESRKLWIDAICLNQDDEIEKAQQIPMMGNIYRMAASVDIWLGLEDSMTVRMLRLLRKLSRLPDVTKWSSQREMVRRISFLMKKFLGAEAIGAVYNFFQLPWFSRRWIIQEACLNNNATVYCGDRSIALSLLQLAAERFQYLDMSDYGTKVAANLGHATTKCSMLQLLWHFHNAACLEPKDRIAAFSKIGLDGQQFHLNYTKHWTEIYKDFAAYSYREGSNDSRLQLMLHLFEFGPLSKGDDTSYPSWVPDWYKSRCRRLPYNGRKRNTDTFEQYPTSPGYSPRAVVGFSEDSLQIYWKASAASRDGHRIAMAATLDSIQHTVECKTNQVTRIVDRLFPSVPVAKIGIMALAYLLKVVSDFRHPIAERDETSRSLGKFERSIHRYNPDLDCQELLIWLRTLESVLQDFGLIELIDEGSLLGRGYGIGPKSIQIDDIIIPLWELNCNTPKAWLRVETSEISIRLFTMLAVRCGTGGLRAISKEDEPVQTGRIIGPVTCVVLTKISDLGDKSTTDEQDDVANRKTWRSIRLI